MNCPICKNNHLEPTGIRSGDRQFGHGGVFDVHECPACRLGITVPFLTEDEIGRYYSGGYGEYSVSRSRLHAYYRRKRVDRAPFRNLDRAPGRLLDVGCATGQIGSELIARGWTVSGVDPDPGAVTQARTLGLDARIGDIGAFEGDEAGFDAVLFHHSLEHVPDPVDALRRAHALTLSRRGQVAVAVPNWEAPLRHRFGSCWFQLDVPRHRWHYSQTALRRAADAAGLRVVTTGTTPAIESFLGSVQYRLFGTRKVTGAPFFMATLTLSPLDRILAPSDTAFMIAEARG